MFDSKLMRAGAAALSLSVMLSAGSVLAQSSNGTGGQPQVRPGMLQALQAKAGAGNQVAPTPSGKGPIILGPAAATPAAATQAAAGPTNPPFAAAAPTIPAPSIPAPPTAAQAPAPVSSAPGSLIMSTDRANHPTIAAPSLGILNDISRLKGDVSLLELKLQKAKLEADIRKAKADGSTTMSISPDGLPVGLPTGLPMPYAGPSPALKDTSLPVVRSISGSGGVLRASVFVQDAGQYNVKKGSALPNGYTVKDISINGVTLISRATNEEVVIGVSSGTPAKKEDDSAQSPVPMPIAMPLTPPFTVQQ